MIENIKNIYTSPFKLAKMPAIFLWGFSCGIPLLLVMSTLTVRLYQANVSLIHIGLFSLATTPYALKFFISPLIERFEPPLIRHFLDRTRGWMLIFMIGIISSLLFMASVTITTPSGLTLLFIAALLTSSCSALTDTAEAELRINLLNKSELGTGIASYTSGYRLGMLTSSGGALIIASFYDWFITYTVMAALVGIGIIAVLLTPPYQTKKATTKPFSIKTLYYYLYEPLTAFFKQPGWLLALLIIFLFKFSDDVIVMMANPFFLSSGITKYQIGLWMGSIGLIMMIVGSVLGGWLVNRFGALKILFFAGLSFMLVCLCFLGFHYLISLTLFQAYTLMLFKILIFIDTFVVGMSDAAYMTMIAARCNIPYTASQNAFLTSVMACSKALFASSSGYLVTQFDWSGFFLFACLMMLPSLFFIQCLIKLHRNKKLYMH